MATEEVVEQQHEDPTAYAGVLRFYELAKRAEWQVRDLPWGELPPIPEGKGSPERQARRPGLWRPDATQELQGPEAVCRESAQLVHTAPGPEGKSPHPHVARDQATS